MRIGSMAGWLLPLCLGFGLVASGCGKGGDQTNAGSASGGSSSAGSTAKTLTIGFSQVGAESAWRTAETKSVQDEAAARHIDLKFSDAQQQQENQISAIRAFIAQGVDAIILDPVVVTGWDPVLKEAKQANIPVFLADRGIDTQDPSLYVTLVGSDFVNEGHEAGDALAKLTGDKCNIAVLEGTPGAAPAIDRAKGFGDAIAAYPDMKIIKSETGEFTRAKGKEVMEAFLKSPEGPNINALFAHNDDMAIGAIQAIEEAGRKPGTDITIVSCDGIHDAFQALIDGKLNTSVECNPLLGPTLFDAVQKSLNGQTLPKKILVPEQVFDQTSAKTLIASRQY